MDSEGKHNSEDGEDNTWTVAWEGLAWAPPGLSLPAAEPEKRVHYPGLLTASWKLGSDQLEQVSQPTRVSSWGPRDSCLSQAKAAGMRTALLGMTVSFPKDPLLRTKDSSELHSWRGSCRICDARKHCGRIPKVEAVLVLSPENSSPNSPGPPSWGLLSEGPKPSVSPFSFSPTPPLTSSTFFLLDLSLGAQAREAPFSSTVYSGVESLEGCLCGKGKKGWREHGYSAPSAQLGPVTVSWLQYTRLPWLQGQNGVTALGAGGPRVPGPQRSWYFLTMEPAGWLVVCYLPT